MIDMQRVNNSLYYASISPSGDVVHRWFWLDAPRNIREAFRRRSDYFTKAENCVLSRDKRHHVR